MTAPTMHALFDGSDHGLIADNALERVRRHLDPDNWRVVPRTYETGLLSTLLAEHEALLRRVADAPVVRVSPCHGGETGTVFTPGQLIGQSVRILAEPGEVDRG